ncbi:hypothetical protein GQ53DRAFT_755772 [Thozetella sp. PMI_491]|nr:hypothetical protein GQ53DRAFT_755772 [Thozetella sp. PMI_491]
MSAASIDETAPVSYSQALDVTGIALVAFTIFVFLLPLFLYFPPVLPSRTDAILQTHNRLGIEPGSARGGGSKPATASASSGRRIKNLWIYPVQSCKGIELAQSKVLPIGLEHDRLFAFAQLKSPFPVSLDAAEEEKNQHRWELVTQRQFPLLSTVSADMYIPDIIKHKGEPFKTSDAFLVLRFPWQERGFRGVLSWIAAKLARGRNAVPEKEIVLSVAFPSKGEIEAYGYEWDEVLVQKATVAALNVSSELPRELQLYLGVSNKLGLFRMDPSKMREAYRRATMENDGPQAVVAAKDTYPLHLFNISSAKIHDEKPSKGGQASGLEPSQLRASIFVDGVEPQDEETWASIRFEPGRLSRRQASTFHVSRSPNADQGVQVTPLFENTGAGIDHAEGWLEVGMEIQVLERR